MPTERPKSPGRGRRLAPMALPPGGALPEAVFSTVEQDPARHFWDSERIIAKLREFDRHLPAGASRSGAIYRRHLPEHPDWPAYSTVQDHGGWKALMDEAKRRNSK